jgi:hypothetical protein
MAAVIARQYTLPSHSCEFAKGLIALEHQGLNSEMLIALNACVRIAGKASSTVAEHGLMPGHSVDVSILCPNSSVTGQLVQSLASL